MASEDFSEKFKNLKLNENKDINILLLGESGVGKSTFINSIANYLHFRKFKHAEAAPNLQVLIPSKIQITKPNLEVVEINVGPTDENEHLETGQSATQDVKTYVFPIGGGSTRLRLIDTPGMLDVRGIDQDDANCENILSYLSHLEHLHAICFLLRPTTTRITAVFEYCIKQILSRLEKSAVNNIIFIFTNTRGTNYAPSGETFECLKKVIEQIKAKPPHVTIPFGPDNIFSYDNEAFRFLVAVRNGIEYDENVRKLFVDSWKKSAQESLRLISYIIGDVSRNGLPPHQIRNTTSINEARRLIVQLSQPLADITQLINDNIRILSTRECDLNTQGQSLEEMKQKLYIPIVDLKITNLTQPATVCTSRKCADFYKVGDITKWHYKKRCHDPCYLTQVTKEIIGDPGLVHCAAMGGTKNCKKCFCDFNVHMHVYYFTDTVERSVVDQTIQSSITSKENAIAKAREIIEKIKIRKNELEEEKNVIVKTTAQFAVFLQHNAISPYNDSYKSYIKYLIQRENAAGPNADYNQIYHLKDLLNRHEEIKNAFKNSLKRNEAGNNNPESALDSKTILNSVFELYKLKHYGQTIKTLLKSQKASRAKEYNDSYVHHKSSLIPMSDTENKKSKNKKKGKSDKETTDDEKKQKGGGKKQFQTGTAHHQKQGKSDREQTDDERKQQKSTRNQNQRGPPTNQRRGPFYGNQPRFDQQAANRNTPGSANPKSPLLNVSVDLGPMLGAQTGANPSSDYHNYGHPDPYYCPGPPSNYYSQMPPPHDYYRQQPPPADYYRSGPPQNDYYRSGPPPNDYYSYRPPPPQYTPHPEGSYQQRAAPPHRPSEQHNQKTNRSTNFKPNRGGPPPNDYYSYRPPPPQYTPHPEGSYQHRAASSHCPSTQHNQKTNRSTNFKPNRGGPRKANRLQKNLGKKTDPSSDSDSSDD